MKFLNMAQNSMSLMIILSSLNAVPAIAMFFVMRAA
jgi:hypothetical protein